MIQRQLNDLRKIYMQLKTEVATIDRRRKKFRRKEREGESLLTVCEIIYQDVLYHQHRGVHSISE